VNRSLPPNDPSGPVVAGVELGGTKCIALVGQGGRILDRREVPTDAPGVTLAALAAALRGLVDAWAPAALGLASFGPVSLRAGSATYGHMLPTPKPAWSGAAILPALSDGLELPVAIHTDVTGAALAENRWGSARGLDDVVYITVGTGVGVGILVGGVPVTGHMHPEAGHLRVRRVGGDAFGGACPFHGDCLEGLAAGPAIALRTARRAEQLGDDDPAWPFVAEALAEGIASLILTVSPRRVLLGGGVMLGQPHLLAPIRERTADKLAGYIASFAAHEVIAPCSLGGDAGPLGALALAETALRPHPAA
jgi:fructokinase